ncbi:MAG: TolC family protein [Gemmatimonadales bacterium]
MVRRSHIGTLILLLSAVTAPAGAQTSEVPRQLSLAQALQLARANSPTYLQAQANADPAAEAVKAANWAQLPTVSVGGGMGYTGAGSSTFGGTTFNQTSPTLTSSYNVGANWQLNTRNFLNPSIQRATERATQENIAAAGVTLVSDVTSQYLNALRARALVGVGQGQVARDTMFLALTQAGYQIGQKSLVDVRSAQTSLATARVQLLQAEQAATAAKIELVRQIGLPADAGIDSLELTEPFPLVEPNFDFEQLRSTAREQNPVIRALTAQENADRISVHAAHLDRLPTISINGGWSAYTQQFTNESVLLGNQLRSAQAAEANCEFQNAILMGLTTPIQGGIIPDCKEYAGLDATGTALQPSIAQGIHDRNSVFPFNFTRQPVSVSMSISLPIWDSYSRSLRISQAEALDDQARESVRAQQLATDAQVQTQLLAVRSAWRQTQIQDSNRVAARDQLRLAQERYQIGSGTALEIADAQNAVTQAEVNYVTAVYDYHLAVVALEAAVGRPLR